MGTTVRYIFLTAIRDWLFLGLFGGIVLAFILSMFLGSTALVEEAQMTMTYLGGAARIILMVGLITFVCFHVRRAFENREVEVILSRPISRTSFVIAYWLGFAVVGGLLILPLLLLMFALLPGISPVGLVFWGLSILMEAFIVIAFALFCSLILKSAVTSVLLCFAFYVISRMMGFFLYVIESPQIMYSGGMEWLTGQGLRTVSAVLPRLDLYGHTEWLVYGVQSSDSLSLFMIQAAIYVPLLLAAALFDFKHKQF